MHSELPKRCAVFSLSGHPKRLLFFFFFAKINLFPRIPCVLFLFPNLFIDNQN